MENSPEWWQTFDGIIERFQTIKDENDKLKLDIKSLKGEIKKLKKENTVLSKLKPKPKFKVKNDGRSKEARTRN